MSFCLRSVKTLFGAPLRMFILVCPLEIKETRLRVVSGFSLVHSLQRNFLSDVCVNESVRALESKGYNRPRKTWSGKVTMLSYNDQLPPYSKCLPESNENFPALSTILNNDYCCFPSWVWIIKTDGLKCMPVCVVEHGKWLARILHVFCTKLFSGEKLHLLRSWLVVEVWFVSRVGKRWALLYPVIFKPPRDRKSVV